MNRRQFLKSTAALPVLSVGCSAVSRHAATVDPARSSTFRRVRPGDPAWPSDASWKRLQEAVGGRLIAVRSPLDACATAPGDAECANALKQLRNPYFLGDQPALTQTSGWADAWRSAPSVHAVAAEKTEDVVADGFERKPRP